MKHSLPVGRTLRALWVLTLATLIILSAGALAPVGRGPQALTGVDLGPSTKAVDRQFALDGDRLHYTISLANGGFADAPSVLLTDTLPLNTVFVPGSGWASKGIFLGSAGLMWTGPISAGERVTVTFDVTASAGTLGWPITNVAYIDDGVSTVITRTVTTLVNQPDLNSSAKLVDSHFAVDGDRLHYIIILANQGLADAPGVLLTDTLPLNTVFVSGSGWASKGSFVGTSGLMWAGPVDSGERVTVTFDVTVTEGTMLWPITNVAYIDDGLGTVMTRTATTVANPIRKRFPWVAWLWGGSFP